VILRQYYLGCLSQASYLVGDETTGEAAVVDPRRDVDEVLADAESAGLRVRHAILTHFHADFVSGHLEVRERTGAEVVLGRRARAEYPFRAVADGDEIRLGSVRLRVMETPGHTPESICLLVFDERDASGGTRPHAVLTGDTLFCGDVGRPDLLVSEGVPASALAEDLHASVSRLLALPDETLVYPAHGAGSLCGKRLSSETYSTIGAQRRSNAMLRPMPREAFVAAVSADPPPMPAYFAHDATENRRARETLDATLARSRRALPLAEVLRLRDDGTQVLDVREPPAFARGHLAGSVNVGLSGRFASWAGTLLDPRRAVVLVADPGREREAAMRLGRIGLDDVAGWLDGGAAALGARPDLVARTERLDAAQAERALRERPDLTVIDVRTPAEHGAARIEGARNVPLDRLAWAIDGLPAGPLLVQCQSGYRSSMAASVLHAAGRTDVSDLAGGLNAWALAGLPLSSGAPAAAR
jgi:glyoxylase-like metal-dependent hydrolase (beta-lactamase superfamily II)/rhodanese-related sulfurtransferase